jgi:ribosome-associated toxin RatA of RatAB toxin-antitoxin module
MRTVDQLLMHAPMERVFQAATEVERWPSLLGHYRWVRIRERRGDGALVEMAAWRPFGLLRYPTWWVSDMRIDYDAPAVHYRHVEGITRGMDVVWQLRPTSTGTEVLIVHEWDGPRWPLIGSAAASWVIGPVFIHGIASRTLAGIARHVEGGQADWRAGGQGILNETTTRSSDRVSDRPTARLPDHPSSQS